MNRLQYTKEQKQESVIALCTRSGSAKEVAQEYGVSREVLYTWKNELLGREGSRILPKQIERQLPDDRDTLLVELKSLKKQVYRLQLEKDVLEATAEILKKTRVSIKKS